MVRFGRIYLDGGTGYGAGFMDRRCRFEFLQVLVRKWEFYYQFITISFLTQWLYILNLLLEYFKLHHITKIFFTFYIFYIPIHHVISQNFLNNFSLIENFKFERIRNTIFTNKRSASVAICLKDRLHKSRCVEERNVVECERLYSVNDVGVIKYVTENRVSRIDSPLLNFLARLQQLFFPESFVRKRERERVR